MFILFIKMSEKGATLLFLIILISFPLLIVSDIFGKNKLCCNDRDCEEFCGSKKFGVCTGNPNCQTTSTGVNPDKTTGQGKCKCTDGGECCNDQHCGCKKGFHPVCESAACHSTVSGTGDVDYIGHGKCKCVRHGCCLVSDCKKKKCSKGSVLRCVGKYGKICSSGRCACETTCQDIGYSNAFNDCEKNFGHKCPSKQKPIALCQDGKCSCSDQAECLVDENCKGFAGLGRVDNKTSMPSYEKLVCSPKHMKARCIKGQCKCTEIDKCTADLCHVALKNELDCCQKHLPKPEDKTKCADGQNKEYEKCVKNPDCYRDNKNRWMLQGGIPCSN